MIINKKDWYKCKLCNQTIDNLCTKYGGGGKYKTDSFKTHLEKDHNISLEDYFINRPVCKCGICNKIVKIIISN